jgi:ABC-type polysaccharide/polyol phosphate export permease
MISRGYVEGRGGKKRLYRQRVRMLCQCPPIMIIISNILLEQVTFVVKLIVICCFIINIKSFHGI